MGQSPKRDHDLKKVTWNNKGKSVELPGLCQIIHTFSELVHIWKACRKLNNANRFHFRLWFRFGVYVKWPLQKNMTLSADLTQCSLHTTIRVCKTCLLQSSTKQKFKTLSEKLFWLIHHNSTYTATLWHESEWVWSLEKLLFCTISWRKSKLCQLTLSLLAATFVYCW